MARIHGPIPLRADHLLLAALALTAVGFALAQPQSWRVNAAYIDWQTVSALAGLLIITKAIETSGLLQRLARRVLRHITDQRLLALALLAFAMLLAATLTNDISLSYRLFHQISIPFLLVCAGSVWWLS